jgi:hypothetical protein
MTIITMTNDYLLPLYAASCYTTIDSMKTTLKRPLIDRKNADHCEEERPLINALFTSPAFTSGAIIGFFVQITTLGACAFEMLRWGNADHNAEDEQVRKGMLFWCIRLLGYIDLYLYTIIWLTFSLTMTQYGYFFLRKRFLGRFCLIKATRRSTFYAGINTLLGIVVGSFVAWATVDVLLGSPIPLAPILFTLFADLLLCYFMAVCYDWGDCGDAELDLVSGGAV